MANTRSAAKQARKAVRRKTINRRVSNTVKERLKQMRAAFAAGKKTEAQEAARIYLSTLDKAVKTGQVHRNSAARHKSVAAKALAKLA